jgi:hypothetical protein
MNKSDVIFALKIFSLVLLLFLGYNNNKGLNVATEQNRSNIELSNNQIDKTNIITEIKADASQGFFVLTSRNNIGVDRKN